MELCIFFIRVIILPFILFKIFRSKLKNPFWSINILFLPIMWIIFYYCYAYAPITWVCAGVGLLIFIILCCLANIPNKFTLLRNTQKYIIINLFELCLLYIPSVFYSASLFYSSRDIYFLWIELFTFD